MCRRPATGGKGKTCKGDPDGHYNTIAQLVLSFRKLEIDGDCRDTEAGKGGENKMEGDHLPGLGLGGWGEDGDEEVDEALQNS